jgi:hypothetical protein
MPQRTLSHDKYIGDFVFATENKRLALMYLAPKGFSTLMNPKLPNPNIVVCGEAENVIKKDKGGSLYVLDGKSFRETPQEGLSDYEMVSLKPVVPLEEIDYPGVINALLEEGISVYFTDESTFNSLILNDRQENMIKRLPKYLP